MTKIVSECYELVKLCDFNCSGLVFLRHSVVILAAYSEGVLKRDWSSRSSLCKSLELLRLLWGIWSEQSEQSEKTCHLMSTPIFPHLMGVAVCKIAIKWPIIGDRISHQSSGILSCACSGRCDAGLTIFLSDFERAAKLRRARRHLLQLSCPMPNMCLWFRTTCGRLWSHTKTQ